MFSILYIFKEEEKKHVSKWRHRTWISYMIPIRIPSPRQRGRFQPKSLWAKEARKPKPAQDLILEWVGGWVGLGWVWVGLGWVG